jgi:ankyrin repeat protein
VLTKHDLNVRDSKNNSALFYSVSNSYYEVTKVLLELGANINLKNSLGNTALHKAFMTKNMLMINLLLTHGASLMQLNDFMQGPTYFAPTSMINELGLNKYVTHYLSFEDFEKNFK